MTQPPSCCRRRRRARMRPRPKRPCPRRLRQQRSRAASWSACHSSARARWVSWCWQASSGGPQGRTFEAAAWLRLRLGRLRRPLARQQPPRSGQPNLHFRPCRRLLRRQPSPCLLALPRQRHRPSPSRRWPSSRPQLNPARPLPAAHTKAFSRSAHPGMKRSKHQSDQGQARAADPPTVSKHDHPARRRVRLRSSPTLICRDRHRRTHAPQQHRRDYRLRLPSRPLHHR